MRKEIRGKMFIDGKWVESVTNERTDVINPANNKVIGSISSGNEKDAEKAVAAAKASFYERGEWRRMDAVKRADMLFEISDAIDKRADEIAEIESMDNGKPFREALADVDDAVYCFQYYGGLTNKPHGGVYDVHDGFGKMQAFTRHEPIGVCGLITPWNYPILMGVQKIAPALAAGNSIVYKPSSNTTLSSIILFEIFEELGMPRGSVNLITGSGSKTGNVLAESFDVDMVTFTGSTEIGRGIAIKAAQNLKKVGLELGGKSPNVIFGDCDLESAVEWAMTGIFYNQGEVCSAGSRILVEESFKDEFMERFIARAEKMTLGDPMKDPDMGAIVSESQMNTVLEYIEIGKKEGARCLTGGARYTEGECKEGFFIRPTIFDQCTSDMEIVKKEIFGPVVTVQTFKSEEEAIAMANDTIYGLAGAVFTSDINRAFRVIGEIRAGITWINCYNPAFIEAPWGGYKMSGQGRELGVHGLEEYQEIKQININMNENPTGWYPQR